MHFNVLDSRPVLLSSISMHSMQRIAHCRSVVTPKYHMAEAAIAQCSHPCYIIVSLQILCTLSACLQDGDAAARMHCAMLNFNDYAPKPLCPDAPCKVAADLWESSCPVVPLDCTKCTNHPMQTVGSATSLLPLKCLLKSSKSLNWCKEMRVFATTEARPEEDVRLPWERTQGSPSLPSEAI